jgi:hypothetical protein
MLVLEQIKIYLLVIASSSISVLEFVMRLMVEIGRT